MSTSEAEAGTVKDRPPVAVSRRGDALWARIERPGQGNACNSAVMEGLETWLAAAVAEEGLKALVLTGSGGVFCAGADMKEGAALLGDEAAAEAYVRRGRDLVETLASAPLPTIAAVNGVALAGGFELVLAADFAVAARSARLGDGHVAHGVVPGWGSTARLPRLVGAREATLLLLTGETRSADEMLELGVLTAVADDDRLEAAVEDLVDRLATGPAAQRVLELTRNSTRASLDAALAAEWDALTAHLRDPALREGVTRFVDGRETES